MKVTFWGVRGSFPVPGPNTVRYGGHTSCVEVRNNNGDLVILDAGTGLRGLGQRLNAESAGQPRSYQIFLSHVHWDHIQGLPFFEPAYLPGTEISIYAQRAAADELQQVIGGITRHEFYPVSLDATPAQIEFNEVGPESHLDVPGFQVRPVALNHPFGALGYIVRADGQSVAYVSDTAPFCDMLHKQHFVAQLEKPSAEDLRVLGEMESKLIEALTSVNTVIYDTHFLPEEYKRFPHWGHSTPDHALDICEKAKVERLVLFHHAPSHDDDAMDEVAKRYGEIGAARGIEVIVAKEQSTLIAGPGGNKGQAADG